MLGSLVLVTTVLVLVAVQRTAAVCAHAPGYAYIIGENVHGSHYYKVGGSVRGGNDRLSEIQIGNPRPLVVRAQWPVNDCYDAEEAAHVAAAQNSAP